MKAVKAVWRCFWTLPVLLKIIWCFCLLGFIFNIGAVWHDVHGHGILLRLHSGFLVLYGGQVVFMLCKERLVFILSLLQALLALMSNLDFTFVPALRVVGDILYMIHGQFSLDGMEVYKYVFVSACFTLELLKTFLIWWLLPSYKEKMAAAAIPAEIQHN